MRKFLLISILCLFAFTAFSQNIVIGVDYLDGHKCASASVRARVQFSEGHTPTISRTWYVQGEQGVYSTNSTCEYFFTTPGTYWVTLEATWGTTTKKDSVKVTIYPTPEFSISKGGDSICPGGSIPFFYTMIPASDAGRVASVVWEFGDGSTSTDNSPNHIYSNPANTDRTYGIRLTVTDTSGCATRIDSNDFVFVRSKPVVRFLPDNSSFCFDQGPEEAEVHFTNYTDTAQPRSSWAINTYSWVFGDGTPIDNQSNPSHTYQYPSGSSVTVTFYPKLIARDQYNCVDSFTLTSPIMLQKLELNYGPSNKILVCDIPDTITLRGIHSGCDYKWTVISKTNPNTVLPTPSYQTNQSYYFRQAGDTGTYVILLEQSIRNTNCVVSDTITISVYDKIPSTILATDTNECDPAHSITFKNVSQYPWPDLGLGETHWHFGDGNTAQNDSVVHTYGGYGDYTAMMTGLTPYGCPIDTTYQNIHIFKMHAVATVVVPNPMQGPPHGCAPHDVVLANIPDSLVSSSRITSFVWRWDYNGEWDVNDTTLGTTDDEGHTYQDTGQYDVYLTLTNEQGCVHHIPVAFIMVGYPPLVDFTFQADTACKSMISIRVMAYDSMCHCPADTTIARSKANGWSWLDPNDQPLASGDTTTISPNEIGEAYVKLQASHNGCNAVYTPIVDSALGYVCPPIATIDDPKEDPPGQLPFRCDPQYVPFINGSAAKGAIYTVWYAGDTRKQPGIITHDTVGSSKSPLIKYDTTLGDYIQYDENGDSVGVGGNWGFLYDTLPYLFDRGGIMTLYLWAMNDSTVKPYDSDVASNPFFNHCGYCEHVAEQKILISAAKMNFTVSQESICQGDSVIFDDSTISTAGIFGWGFKFDWAADPTKAEEWMGSPLGAMIPIADYQPHPPYGKGHQLTFKNTNRYRAILMDTCALIPSCIRTDTLYFDVFPQSIPDYVSSTDSITFNRSRDTICINADELVHYQDKSSSPFPFDTAEIVKWKWSVGGRSDTVKNPTLHIQLANLHTLTLSIANEYGCESEKVFYDQVLANLITPMLRITNDNTRREFCNKEPILFINRTLLDPEAYNANTYMRYVWDFGDGKTDTIYTTYSAGKAGTIVHAYDLPNLSNKVYVKLSACVVDQNTKLPIGCEAEVIDSLTVIRPIAKFYAENNILPCPDEDMFVQGRTVQFRDTSLGRINQSVTTWYFFDGYDSVVMGVKDPVHTYMNAGNYPVLLVVQDSSQWGCRDSLFMDSFVEIAGPRGMVTASPRASCNPLSTFFFPIRTDGSSFMTSYPDDPYYKPDSIRVYPDGGASGAITVRLDRQSTPSRYAKAGVYLPTYYLYKTVIYNGQEQICVIQRQMTDSIYVVDLDVSFDTKPLYCPGESVTFTNATTWEPSYLPYDSVKWDFDNSNVSQLYDGETTFGLPGKYKINLVVGIDTICVRNKSIEIEVITIPDISITPDTAISCDGLDVVFIADTVINKSHITNYNWRFSNLSDATVADIDTNTTDNTLTLMFNTSGNYAAELDVTFVPEGCSQIYYDTVIVFAYKSPVAEFKSDPEEGQVDEEFHFTDLSTFEDGNIAKWVWNFGDNNVDSSGSSVTHAYSDTSGYVAVTLYITDEYGCKAEVTHQVLVVEKLAFPNIFTPGGVCPGRPKCEFRPLEDKGFFKEFKLEIYDKWGMLVWRRHCESGSGGSCPDYEGTDFWWDGTNKQGAPVSAGVYYWVVYALPLSEAAPFIQNGSITVAR